MIRSKWQARMRHLPDHRADDALFFAPLHFGDGVIDVVHRDQSDAEQAIRHFLAVIDDPIVIRTEQRLLQSSILDTVQAKPQAWIEYLCGDTVGDHVALAFDRIPAAWARHGEACLAKLF